MIDIKLIRENPDLVKDNIKKKFQDQKLVLVDEVLELDKKNREAKLNGDNLRADRKKTSEQVGQLMKAGQKEDAEKLRQEVQKINASILANAAKLFGKTDDYKYYSTLAEKIKNAINKKYLNMETGIYASGTQTEQSMPLQWGVVPKDMKAKVAHNLSIAVEQTGFHLDVGVLGAKAILNALSENGYAETAYKIATQDTYPSWGWWIVNGATTLVENWDLAAKQDISDNHMMFGEIGGWFFKALGGIRPDSEQPGFKHILLKPHFINELEYSEVKHLSPHGWIISEWKRKGKKIIYNIEIPANSTATFTMPDEIKEPKEVTLTAGKHQIKMELK